MICYPTKPAALPQLREIGRGPIPAENMLSHSPGVTDLFYENIPLKIYHTGENFIPHVEILRI